MPTPLVAGLNHLSREDLELAGGKGANLGELLRAGFSVPPGFVVTTNAYAEAAKCAGLSSQAITHHLSAGNEGPAAIRKKIETTRVPPELEVEILAAYYELGSGPVAVRSSATAEDLPGAAFAGQQDTFLNIAGETELLEAVRRCWASLWTERAVDYRHKRGVANNDVRIAVVVQKMIDAESAGVMFTADPVSGERNGLVIDASPGLGEALVSGAVTPDHYLMSLDGRLREWTPGRQDAVGRVAAERQPLLSVTQLAELTSAGTAVARHFGRPQDIEWAFDSEQLWLLQARPMTALPPAPLQLNRLQRQLGAVLSEYLPVRPYPIDVTTWLPHGPAGMMARVTSSFGIRGAFEDFLVEEEGVVVALAPPSPRPGLGMLAAPFRIASKAKRYDPKRWTRDERFEEFVSRTEELSARDFTSLRWSELIAAIHQVLGLLEPLAGLRADYLPRSGLSLVRLALFLRLLGEAPLLAQLLGGAHTRTDDANLALEELAVKVRENDELSRRFGELEPGQLPALLPENAGFAAAFAGFLDEYGHRETSTPILLTPPTWGESPETVLGLVKMLTASPARKEGRAGGDAALQDLLEQRFIARLGLQATVRRWVTAAREGVAFREDSHFYMTLPLPVLRRAILEVGSRLTRADVLNAADQVFHLRLEELEALRDPQLLSATEALELRSTVRRRAAKRAELSGVPLINHMSLRPSHPAPTDALVVGTPAGGGVASGPARVIREPAEFAGLRSGDVLVCPYTNPSWTPLFARAAAVVVDTGSVASHAAIVAREYGIAAVMGTGNGTAVLKDGQLVTVDGTSGTVTAVVDSDETAPR